MFLIIVQPTLTFVFSLNLSLFFSLTRTHSHTHSLSHKHTHTYCFPCWQAFDHKGIDWRSRVPQADLQDLSFLQGPFFRFLSVSLSLFHYPSRYLSLSFTTSSSSEALNKICIRQSKWRSFLQSLVRFSGLSQECMMCFRYSSPAVPLCFAYSGFSRSLFRKPGGFPHWHNFPLSQNLLPGNLLGLVAGRPRVCVYDSICREWPYLSVECLSEHTSSLLPSLFSSPSLSLLFSFSPPPPLSLSPLSLPPSLVFYLPFYEFWSCISQTMQVMTVFSELIASQFFTKKHTLA